jgi:hypothetical protein
MKAFILCAAMLASVLAASGCSDDKKLAEDEAKFQQTAQNLQDGLQWRLDQATADDIFMRHYSDGPSEPTPQWYTFRHCHELGLATGSVCGPLYARVRKAEQKADAESKAADASLRAKNAK